MKWRTRVLVGLAVLWVSGPVCRVLPAAEPAQRIVAVGDVHGSLEALTSLLRTVGLLDEAEHWIGGNAILVQTGDLTDRGPDVRAVLDFMRRLETEAAAGGGRVESLLGNHEVYNLIGYYDYESTPLPVFGEIASAFADSSSKATRKEAYKEWQLWARKYEDCAPASKNEWMARNPLGFVEYQEALSPRGEYGRWLRERRVAINIQDTLFLHGGISPELPDMGMRSLESINAVAASELAQFDQDREWLVEEGVILDYSTLGELHCAMAFELEKLRLEEPTESLDLRRRRLVEVQSRLPSWETWLLLDPRGPVWFRGYASWSEEEAEAGLASVFEVFGGKRVVVGHTPRPGKIVARFDEQIFLIDTAMAYPELKGRAVALEIRGDEISAVNGTERILLRSRRPASAAAMNGSGLPPFEGLYGHAGETAWSEGTHGRSRGDESAIVSAPRSQAAEATPGIEATENTEEPDATEAAVAGESLSAARGWIAQDGSPLPFSDEEALLEFLRSARVVEKKDIGKGVTRASRLVLEKDGIQIRAAFHDVDVKRRRRRSERGTVAAQFRDSYLNNVAAYEFARLLGLSNLPPTTVRKSGRTRGSVQLWIENATDEAQRREQKVGSAALPLLVRRSMADMWVFDNLINNIDRNQGNMLHDSRGGLWWIDHTRSFGTANRLPNPERMKRCSRSLLAAIRGLDEDATRERLGPYLSVFEIKALFARREALLGYLDERIASRGEDSVLFSYEDVDDAVRVTFEPAEVPESPD